MIFANIATIEFFSSSARNYTASNHYVKNLVDLSKISYIFVQPYNLSKHLLRCHKPLLGQEMGCGTTTVL